MSSLFLKKAALRCLPNSLLRHLKKRYYVKMLRSLPLDNEPDLKVVSYLVTPGDTVIDIGANIGVYTKFLSSMVGPNGSIYSVEPIPETFQMLSAVTDKLKLNNVQIINCALSDSITNQIMEIPIYSSTGVDNYYQARIIKDSENEPSFKHVEVKTNTLDSLFADSLETISFIKVDVEGHELACLRGAKRFLDKTGCAWLIEIGGDPDDASSNARQVFDTLYAKGYTAYWFDGVNLRKRLTGERSINYFFLADKHIKLVENNKPDLLK